MHTDFSTVYTQLQWERELAQAVNIYSENYASANLISSFILGSLETQNIINKGEVQYIVMAS